MQTRLEAAVAREILDEIKDQGRALKWVQERSGVKSRVWGYYFREGTRAIPFAALASICEVLDIKASEIVARAETRVAAAPPADDDLTEGLRPSERAELGRVRNPRKAGVPASSEGTRRVG